MSYDFTALEKKWQEYWKTHKSFAALDPEQAGEMPKRYVLDMFPYPSGAGLHVGHVENYAATDIISRFCRMRGFNVLHPTGWDAFGLPAEQYAIKNNRHPREFTATNIANFRRQIQMLGLSYDWDREIDTTDPNYYKWTQWIFLKLFNSYFDPAEQKAKPIAHMVHELEQGNFVVGPDGSVKRDPTLEGMEAITGQRGIERKWRDISPEERLDIIDGMRLAYTDEAPVNWCPALGTVLANEEVIDGKSEVGGFPVERRPMRQWMLRITAYADRLLDDLALLDWPESLKQMQRNWIGRSVGAEVDFDLAPSPGTPGEGGGEGTDEVITVFTTRPDTLYGATYMVLAPEHPLVEKITTAEQKSAVVAYRAQCAGRSERDRMADAKDKSGVFTGAYAINPINEAAIPIYIADYVLMGYGTGAIMAVPAHDERDFAFAKKFGIPIKQVVKPIKGNPPTDAAMEEEGIAINSPMIDGQTTAQAKQTIIDALERDGAGHGSVKYKLRDWLFSRQRYWGEPFPIVLDAMDRAYAISETELPLVLPEVEDYKPTGTPEPPLSKATKWRRVESDNQVFLRETNTMPQWAGSCWYYLRFLDPKNSKALVDPKKEAYWMPVDLYVGGVEHAVLHLLYARFWHKVLFDLGVVSKPEPFARLVNQGLILGEMEYHAFYTEAGTIVTASEARDVAEEAGEKGVRMIATHMKTGEKLLGRRVTEEDVEKTANGFRLKSNPNIRVDARAFKMSKSRGNVANPDDLVREFGADALRLYVMYMGPLEMQKPWNTRDIIGMTRFLNSVWRNLAEGKIDSGNSINKAIDRQMHRTIKKVAEDIESLRFNTAIAELIKLNNEITQFAEIPKYLAENLVLMLAPFAPHTAEELWERLGHAESLARHPWPTFDPDKLVESTMELPLQVNGKLRGKIVVPIDAVEADILAQAAASDELKSWLAGKTVRKQIYVPGKLVNFVVE